MTAAFNEDTSLHTNIPEDGPPGYNDGSLIKNLNEVEGVESKLILFDNTIIGAYSVRIIRDKEYSLEMLFIDPNYREYHPGTQVWKDIEQEYADAKCWMVETPDYSARNHYFYTVKCGFAFEKENVYDNGEKSFIFKKEIHV
jgi:hypothetical protein